MLKVVDDVKNDMMLKVDKFVEGYLLHQLKLKRSRYFFDGDKIFNDSIVLQYYLNYKIVSPDQDRVEFETKPHGNSKTDRKFYPVKEYFNKF